MRVSLTERQPQKTRKVAGWHTAQFTCNTHQPTTKQHVHRTSNSTPCTRPPSSPAELLPPNIAVPLLLVSFLPFGPFVLHLLRSRHPPARHRRWPVCDRAH
jgi:hypothetical protein